MGLMLSVLVFSVGVIEALSCFEHIHYSLKPLTSTSTLKSITSNDNNWLNEKSQLSEIENKTDIVEDFAISGEDSDGSDDTVVLNNKDEYENVLEEAFHKLYERSISEEVAIQSLITENKKLNINNLEHEHIFEDIYKSLSQEPEEYLSHIKETSNLNAEDQFMEKLSDDNIKEHKKVVNISNVALKSREFAKSIKNNIGITIKDDKDFIKQIKDRISDSISIVTTKIESQNQVENFDSTYIKIKEDFLSTNNVIKEKTTNLEIKLELNEIENLGLHRNNELQLNKEANSNKLSPFQELLNDSPVDLEVFDDIYQELVQTEVSEKCEGNYCDVKNFQPHIDTLDNILKEFNINRQEIDELDHELETIVEVQEETQSTLDESEKPVESYLSEDNAIKICNYKFGLAEKKCKNKNNINSEKEFTVSNPEHLALQDIVIENKNATTHNSVNQRVFKNVDSENKFDETNSNFKMLDANMDILIKNNSEDIPRTEFDLCSIDEKLQIINFNSKIDKTEIDKFIQNILVDSYKRFLDYKKNIFIVNASVDNEYSSKSMNNSNSNISTTSIPLESTSTSFVSLTESLDESNNKTEEHELQKTFVENFNINADTNLKKKNMLNDLTNIENIDKDSQISVRNSEKNLNDSITLNNSNTPTTRNNTINENINTSNIDKITVEIENSKMETNIKDNVSLEINYEEELLKVNMPDQKCSINISKTNLLDENQFQILLKSEENVIDIEDNKENHTCNLRNNASESEKTESIEENESENMNSEIATLDHTNLIEKILNKTKTITTKLNDDSSSLCNNQNITKIVEDVSIKSNETSLSTLAINKTVDIKNEIISEKLDEKFSNQPFINKMTLLKSTIADGDCESVPEYVISNNQNINIQEVDFNINNSSIKINNDESATVNTDASASAEQYVNKKANEFSKTIALISSFDETSDSEYFEEFSQYSNNENVNNHRSSQHSITYMHSSFDETSDSEYFDLESETIKLEPLSVVKNHPFPDVETNLSSPDKAFWLIFSGEYTKAMSKDWHSSHFCCWQCDESLTGQRYVLRDDHPYCIKCYESVFANTCEECNRIIGIDSKDLSYKDKHWHEACFTCSKCRVSLVDKQFGSKADKIYCGNCYDAQFASRCDGCGQIFRAGTKKMEYKTRQWHEQCFCCCVCKTPIGTKSFIPREQEIYCAGCYEEKFATRCVKCNKIITSGGVTYKNEPWHRECFTCTNCNTSLAGQRFTSRDEKPYCAECFGELFAKRCTSCCKPITGIGGTRFISFEDRHWHNDCFICASCKTSLVGKGFITDSEDIICPDCAKQKLM